MYELKPCPFCGGKARLSFKDVEFGGMNYRGDRKVKYRFQVICNKCHSRGKPVKTDFLINANPWDSLWSGRKLPATDVVIKQTEMVRPWAEQALVAWGCRMFEVDELIERLLEEKEKNIEAGLPYTFNAGINQAIRVINMYERGCKEG